PDKIRHIIVEENSNNIISRETTPTVKRGNIGESTFRAICITITAPMKKDIIITIHIEFTPKRYTPFMNSFINSRILSGTDNTFLISNAYTPRFSNVPMKLMWFIRSDYNTKIEKFINLSVRHPYCSHIYTYD